MRLHVSVMTVLITLVLSACGGALVDSRPTTIPTPLGGHTASEAQPGPTVGAAAFSVGTEIYKTTFMDKLTVQVGTRVTWLNTDSLNHTVTSGRPKDMTSLWDSGRLSRDHTFSYTFNEVGVFPYFCQIHPSVMVSRVTVVESIEGQ